MVEIKEFLSFFKDEHKEEVISFLSKKKDFVVKNTAGSYLAIFASWIVAHKDLSFFVFDSQDRALLFFNDIRNILPSFPVYFLPATVSDIPIKQLKKADEANRVIRNETLNHLLKSDKAVVVSYTEGFLQKVLTTKTFTDKVYPLKKGDIIDYDAFFDFLEENAFSRSDFVYSTGEFSVRGNIIDIYPFNSENPIRIVLDEDNAIESIRFFDTETQLSIKEKFNSFDLLPDIEDNTEDTTAQVSIFEYITNANTIFYIENLPSIYEFAKNAGADEEYRDIISIESLQKGLSAYQIIESGITTLQKNAPIISFDTHPLPAYSKKLEIFLEDFEKYYGNGFLIVFSSSNVKQYERVNTILLDNGIDANVEFLKANFSGGFIDRANNVFLITDVELFGKVVRPYRPLVKKQRATHFIQDLSSLKPGDYVVHIDYGIGRFAGLEKIEKNGKIQETVKILYKDNDVLYVSIHALHKISKYRGKDGIEPTIHKLGGKAWINTKQKAKKKIKDIAKDLIKLYAKRKSARGFAFSPDTSLQIDLEASFMYQDTPDQQKATEAVKTDMEKPVPMDRLVCGDVGFGKTEVAVRAAFKAVVDGKQVAVLVPTTILALQHYKTFSERLKNFPVTVDYISRFKSTKAQKETLQRLQDGKVDIIIGTHRLLSKDVKFKNLGLLVLDEEQKFGVAAKEKLRHIKHNVDTLTLTATPIPRTLQFSLMGARDISIINTPPPNRLPVHTELITFDPEVIREIIMYELNRGGQVFFVHNRIQNISKIKELFNEHIPEARTVVAHGQMKPETLEKIMVSFIEGEYDVLISTSIVESGLDITRANTMIINNAHHFGLSDLHQLRGRVGRSNTKAFCYLITPPLLSLPNKTRKKLMALVEYSDLGSGFNIALQDLEIRGAGNLLGAEQSGFITDIGMETYQKILDEAIRELRIEETDLFKESTNDTNEKKQVVEWAQDCKIDTDLPVALPAHYIENDSERLKLYYELNKITNEDELNEFKSKLVDRFGPIPNEAGLLFDLIKIKWIGKRYGMEKITYKNNYLKITFVENTSFYQSDDFGKILKFIQKNNFRLIADNPNKAVIVKEPLNEFVKMKKIFMQLK